MRSRIIIENMEEPTPWVLGEYVNSYRIAGERLLITNVNREMIEALWAKEPRLQATVRPVREVCRGRKTLLLDPDSSVRLNPRLLPRYDCAVVGGIMGDYPRKGRTRIIRESIPWADTANLGPDQFSVDGTVYILVEILRGRRLEDIPVIRRPSLEVETPFGRYIVELPFAYPLIDGKPLISDDVLRYLSQVGG